MSKFEVKAGSVIGQDHTMRQANCQDKYSYTEVEVEGQLYQVGVVCDGCSSGGHSEVGAGLLAEFMVRETGRQLRAGEIVADVPPQLYRRGLAFLHNLSCLLLGDTPSPGELALFTEKYLLATVLGFIIGPQKTVIFAAGDGLIILNDRVIIRDEDNAPRYLAYGLLEPIWLTGEALSPSNFEIIEADTAAIERLAIWTDGFDPTLSHEIWKPGGPRSLQRQLNVWAKEKRFGDDCTGIAVVREIKS